MWIVEMALVAALFVADRYDLVPLSNTPFLLLLGWISLRLRGLGWHNIGFVRPPNLLRVLTLGTAAGIGMELLTIFITEPLIARFTGTYPDLSDFRPMVGNLRFLLISLVPMWVLAAFGEELVYRGYLMNRIAGLGGETRWAWLVSLVAVSTFFGLAHGESQGLTGILQEGFSGLLLGFLYFRSGRTLSLPIVAHGVSNTMAFILIYFNRYPGV